MSSPLLLALALAGAAAPDAPAAEAPTREPPAAEAPAGGGDLARPPERDGPRHELALGPHSTTFFSKEGSQYTFHSASLGVLLSRGARGPFLNAFFLVPLQARQDGRVYATADYYQHRWGGDALVGAQWRWLVRGAEAEVGPGLHGTFIYLPGKPGYRDFSALPLGAGVGGILRWRTGHERFSRRVNWGTYASVAYDFYDPLRAGDLAHGFTLRAGVLVGLGVHR